MFRKYSIFILLSVLWPFLQVYSQDTLYYSVENVSEEFSTSTSARMATNKDFKQLSEENERSLKLRRDMFLIPYIISQIKKYSAYKTILPEDDFSKIREPYMILKIAINVFNNNIEYQLNICNYQRNDYSILNVSNFFINPDMPEYQAIINSEIQKMFDGYGGTNKPPVAKIRVDGKLVNGDTTFFRSHIDTIFIDGSSSVDEETPKKSLEYIWRVNKLFKTGLVSSTDVNAYISDFKFEDSQQKLVIREPGKYTFSLEVSDGITRSVRDSVNISISVINKPLLELHKSSFDKIYQGNIMNYLSERDRLFKTPDSIGFNIINFDASSKMIFKYLNSEDRIRKYFLEIKPGSKESSVVLSYKPDNHIQYIKDTSTVRISGLRIDTCRYDRTGSVWFWLNRRITPGSHRYLMYTDLKGVTSNYDTVTISFREKSFFSLFTGFEKFNGQKKINGQNGDEYLSVFSMNLVQLGFRFYLTQRFSADIIGSFPQRIDNYTGTENQRIGLNYLSGKINYDIPSGNLNLYTGNMPLFFSGFLGAYNLHVFENNKPDGYLHFGAGIKIRVQLFANNSKIGIWYFEAENAWYRYFKEDSYITDSFGFNLIYSFWRY